MLLRVGTRGSRLALTQAELAAERLRRPGVEIALVPITTAGDRDRTKPFGQIGERGVFVKEIEEALLAGRIDVAVHSAKDMTSSDAAGLAVGAYAVREDPRDALCGAERLRPGMRIGTASIRRRAQLLALEPSLRIEPLRGNIDTRLRKRDERRLDAIVLAACGLEHRVAVVALPSPDDARAMSRAAYYRGFQRSVAGLSLRHLLAIERVGPSHTRESLQAAGCWRDGESDAELPIDRRDRCHTMRGIDITDQMSPAHWLFEAARRDRFISTTGIGDGGNELGMGRIPWDVIRRNIPRGGLVACRVPADHLVVAGVSNWGGYALAAGVYAVRGQTPPDKLFDPEIELRILRAMVDRGGLVDGVLAKRRATVDGLTWDQYAGVLPKLRDAMKGS